MAAADRTDPLFGIASTTSTRRFSSRMRETFPEPLLVGVDDQLAHSARVLQFELGLRGKYQCWVSRLWRPSPAEKKDNGMGLKLN